MIQINTITTNILRVQTYILQDETRECVIIDPGFQSDRERNSIDDFIKNQQLTVKALWFTHLHLDHILGAQHIIEKYNVETFACPDDRPLLIYNESFAKAWGIETPLYDLNIQHEVKDGDILHFGNSNLKAINVPGHSRGSIVYYCEEQAFCIGGDTLFRGSIGRSDFYGGSESQLIDAIKEKILTLPDDTTIFPGHGYATTVGDEKMFNPYLK